MENPVKTLKYTKDNIKLIESKGYTKSNVCGLTDKDSVIRYSIDRKVYWFSSKHIAYKADCIFTKLNIMTLRYF